MQFSTLRKERPLDSGKGKACTPNFSGRRSRHRANGFGASGSWEQIAAEQNAETLDAYLDRLANIPTGLGKLVCLASLKKWLSDRHRELFGEWLYLSLEEQCQDLEKHASEAANLGILPEGWLTLPAYSGLIPDNVSDAEKELYLGNLDILLEVIRGQACQETRAWDHRGNRMREPARNENACAQPSPSPT